MHYLQVFGAENETIEEAIERVLAKRGITEDEVGYIEYWSADGPYEIDKRNYKKREDLIGWREAQAVWQEIFSNIKPTTGLPSER